MEKFDITFLGTANAIPTKERNHSAILVSFANENILVDCGEGAQRQFRIAGLSMFKLTKVLITHWHGDHIIGLLGVFQTLAMLGYDKTLHIYGPHGTKRNISLIEELIKHFKINIEVHEVANDTVFETRDFKIESTQMSHGIPCNAYSIILKDKIRLDRAKLKKLKLPNSPLLGQLQAGKDIKFNNRTIKAKSVSYVEKGKKLSIILDTKLNPNAIELAKNSDLLICESSFSKEDAQQAQEYNHLTAEDAATIAKKAKASALALTHISQRYEHNLKPIEAEAKKIFKNVKIVKDFDELVI